LHLRQRCVDTKFPNRPSYRYLVAVFVEILPYSSDVRLVHFLETWTTSGFHDTKFPPPKKSSSLSSRCSLLPPNTNSHNLPKLVVAVVTSTHSQTTLSLCRLICNPQPKRRKYIEIHLPHERISDGEFYYRFLNTVVEVTNHMVILDSIDITKVVSNSTNTICII
jgi:hypothetical protein